MRKESCRYFVDIIEECCSNDLLLRFSNDCFSKKKGNAFFKVFRPSLYPCTSSLFLAKGKKNIGFEWSKLNLPTFSRVKVGGYCAQIEGFFRPGPKIYGTIFGVEPRE